MDAKRKRALDEINLLECDLNEDFVPNYAVLDVVDEMMCQIISVEKSLKTSNPGDSHRTRPSLEGRPSPKLPKLPLPKFSGDIKEWPLFIECYNSMIHNNLELNDVDKVHYLIGCLSGSALNVCSGIPPTGDNYNIILKALIDKFEDKRILANSYIEQILHFKQASIESYSSLNIFLERFDSTVTALLKLNIDNLADYFIAYLALAKLNPETQKLFENSRRSSEMPSYEEIKIFVKEQAKICSRTQNNDKISTGSYSKNNSTGGKPKVTHSFVVHGSSSTSNLKCHLCKSDSHYLNTCSKFLKMSPEERYRQVRNNNLCLNCLATHKVINCRSNNTCRTCHARHHTLLHFKSNRLSACSSGDKTNSKLVDISDSSKAIENDQFNPLPSTSTTDVIVNNNGSSNPSEQALVNFCSLTNTRLSRRHCNTVLLSTVKVHIVDNDGCLLTFRFLIDSCSQANFLNLEAFRRLKLTMQKNSSEVRGIGSSCSNVCGISNIVVISQYDSSKRYPIEVLVVDKITEQLPRVEINLKALSHLDNLPLADNDFCRPNKIDGIIGADIFPYLLGQKRVVGPPGTPVAIETTLGFVVMGEAPTLSSSHMSFGIKPSPFLAMRTVRQLSQDEKLSFPLASEFVAQDMYVDDFVSSVPSTSQAVELYHQLVEMFQTGGFQIMKWATNSKELLANIPLENHTSKIVSFESDRLKVLGLQWQPSLDVFSFSFDVPKEICSKRHILSTVARCYDPLGFLAPVTLLAKLLIKQLWILKLDWDEVPPPDIIRKWDQFKNDLPLLSTFEIPRHIGTGNNHPVIIIGFCDACSSSYGDSTVTLNWVATHPSKLPTFVANRVAQIQTFISPNSWFHVDGQNNISDCLSRGLTPRQLVNNPTWTLGPDWLKLSPSLWPICRVAPNVPENKVVSVVVTKTYDLDNSFLNLIERKSKWLRLLNSVVYVLRFLKLLLKSSVISNIDLEKAEMVLLKIVQYKHFKSEITLLGKNICPSSLKTLRPFIQDGIIRVGGRLSNSDLDFDNRHPILLPKRDRFVDLLIDYYHSSNLHTGLSLVLALLRLRYWILSARSVVRYRIQKMQYLFSFESKVVYPINGKSSNL
ncbi:hypothetical protein NQ318_014616 [Aromia moschata]|uniref:Peptidase aspartic putative domain-containing protein n=1 Tax=Aromia moschata TaxID=1265417 RepID=A0AAV8ZDG5_9CUCU|nr:hypothetical protein NQ318_014616 [Aromia moschata]